MATCGKIGERNGLPCISRPGHKASCRYKFYDRARRGDEWNLGSPRLPMPAEHLTYAAQEAMKRYAASGLFQPGDAMYDKIKKRLEER
jgi:hypothetical protein